MSHPAAPAAPAAAMPVAPTATAPAPVAPPAGELQPVVPISAATSAPEVSPRTGEVRRPVLAGVSSGLLALGAVATTALLVATLYVMGQDLLASSWLVRWINPQPLWAKILMPLLTAVTLAPTVVASAVGAFWSWNGRSYARWFGAAGAATSLLCLTATQGPLAWVAIAATVAGAAMMWLPRLRRYDREQAEHLRRLSLPEHTHTLPERVEYGPLPRYR